MKNNLTLLPVALAVLVLAPSEYVSRSVQIVEAVVLELKEPKYFKIALEGDWIETATNDPEQRAVYSKQSDVGVTISRMSGNFAKTGIDRAAEKLKDFRLAAEKKAGQTFQVHMTIASPVVAPFSRGYQVAYYGHDSRGRQFRYLGLVMSDKMINIYAESKSQTQEGLENVFASFIQGLAIE